ncbi:putative DNA-directed RNA polymerase III subunit rpc6 [Vanrija pseudolonga]|uniref:DNA-directed RNA polymerase III subunit rpc6 n=1 Tax=Vanrija pseudolonga TaxID=143232 RepID=A0AAF0YEX4_9TREE|nr:putative DNA-directed RNA polymerase III subunit rpc6 [Vanrija pseudolonga]
MSAKLSSVEQKVYNKVMASKKKAMTLPQIEAAIPGLSKKELNTAINNIVKFKLFAPTKSNEGAVIFHAVAVEAAKKQNTLTIEQQFVLGIIEKAGNKGISKSMTSLQVNPDVMPRSQVLKCVDSLEKLGLIKSFKSVNGPITPLFILANLNPPEDIAGGIWFDESKEYDSAFVDTLKEVVLGFVTNKTFPNQKGKDSISKLVANPIHPIGKTPALPTPEQVLRYILATKVTSAALSVKNVMEIARALELDGLIEAIKPVGGVSVEQRYESDSDGEPAPKRRRAKDSDDEIDPEERARRERKNREKLKAKLKEKKREEKRREKEKKARAKEKEKEKRRKEKEKEKRRKEKDRKRKERDQKKKGKSKESKYIDSDDEPLRELDDSSPVAPKRKRVIESGSESDPISSDSDTDSSSDSDTDSDSDSDSDVSSVASEDIDSGHISLKPKSSTVGISANPFFSSDGSNTLIDLDDQAVVYRATRRLTIPLGQMQAPCGGCPQFNFCEEDGPVNPSGCSYFSDWLSGTNGGWTAEVKAEKAAKAAEEEKARRRALAEANGEPDPEQVNGDETVLYEEGVYEEGGEYEEGDYAEEEDYEENGDLNF